MTEALLSRKADAISRRTHTLRALFCATISVLEINNIKPHNASLASFLEANDISQDRFFNLSTLPATDSLLGYPDAQHLDPSLTLPRAQNASKSVSHEQSRPPRDGNNGAAQPNELAQEPDLVSAQSKDADSSRWRVDGSTNQESSVQDPTGLDPQGITATKCAAGDLGVRPSEAPLVSSDDTGSLDAEAIQNLTTEQRSSRPAIVHLPSKEAQEERLEHQEKRKSRDEEQGPIYTSKGGLHANGLAPPTSGEGSGSQSGFDKPLPTDEASRHDAVLKSQMDIARTEAFSGTPSTPDEQLRLEEARSMQPKLPEDTFGGQDSDLKDSQSMLGPSSLPSQFVNDNLDEEHAIPNISDVTNEMNVSKDGITQSLSEQNDALTKSSSALRDRMFSGMNGESPRDLTLSRGPSMRIDTGVPSTFDSSSSITGPRPTAISTMNRPTPSGSESHSKLTTPATSIQSPPERMTTRVSSGALRHKSVSEILGETPKATPVQAEKSAFDRALIESHREDHGSLQTPKSASSFTSPDPAVFKQRLSELKEKERSKLSTVVFAGSRNAENTQQRVDENESPVEDRDYFLTLFAAQVSNAARAQSVNTLVKTAHKTLNTSDHYTDLNERQACAVLKRIHLLQSENCWSLRQVERSAEPKRSLTHWDVLLGQMKWMRTDFREERRWKHAAAKYVAYICATWVASSPDERKLQQIKIRSAPARATSRSLSISTPDLIHSTDDGASEATDDDFSRVDAMGSAPAAIFSLPPEMFVFGLNKSPVAEKLLLELPLYEPNILVQDAALRVTDIEPDSAWKKPIVPVSKYAQGKMVSSEEGPPRKRRRFDYQDASDSYSYSSDLTSKDSENAFGPEQDDVALFDPENKHIRDRIHAGHAFRPPSEHIMPSQSFFECRQSSQWTQAEDDELKKIVQDFAYNWSLISSCLSSPSMYSSGAERRTPWECFERWISLEGLPVEMAKTAYFRAYHGRLQSAQKTVEAQHQALQQQQGNSANQMPIRRRTTLPFTVERRKNARHLHLIDAMRKLAKKRETAIHKQQHVASLAAMRKDKEATKQRHQMHTPQEFSRIKYENSIRYAEHAKNVRANAIANQKAMQAQKSNQQPAQQSNGIQPVRNPGPAAGVPNGSSPNMAAANSHGQIRGSGLDSSRVVPQIPRLMNAQANGVLPTNSHSVPHAPMQPNMQVQMQQRVPPMAPDRMIHEASRLREQQAFVRQQQQQQQQQHAQSNGASGSPSLQHPNMLSQNNAAMLASLQGRASPSINGAQPPLGSSSSPRMTQPQALSSGMTPAVNQISSQFKARHPQASPEQITRMTTDQLYKMSSEARQQAMQAAAGNSNAAAVAANANMGLQVPSSMQQQAAMMTNGGGGPMFNIGNSQQQYAQLMRQQQQSQQRGAGTGGQGLGNGSRSATPMVQRTGSAQGAPRPSQSPSSRPVGLAGGQ